MKQMAKCWALVLCTLILVCSVCGASGLPKEADEATIIGRVSAVDWDDNGNVIAAVFSGTGEEYQIASNAVGKKLFLLDGMTVKATGVVTEDGKGNKALTVTSYEVASE
jgi:hypothetical protein